jgi:hypothetical protein
MSVDSLGLHVRKRSTCLNCDVVHENAWPHAACDAGAAPCGRAGQPRRARDAVTWRPRGEAAPQAAATAFEGDGLGAPGRGDSSPPHHPQREHHHRRRHLRMGACLGVGAGSVSSVCWRCLTWIAGAGCQPEQDARMLMEYGGEELQSVDAFRRAAAGLQARTPKPWPPGYHQRITSGSPVALALNVLPHTHA